MTEQWSFRATGGRGRTILTEETVGARRGSFTAIIFWFEDEKMSKYGVINASIELQHGGDEFVSATCGNRFACSFFQW